jgi:hypothetical protein
MTPQASSPNGNLSGGLFGVGVLSSVLSGVGGYESGQKQKAADDYNADTTLENMRDSVAANQQKFSSLVGTQAGRYAAAGVDIASGSPLLIMAATAARGAQKSEQIEEAGTEEAAMQRYYGKIAAFSGTMSGIGSFLSGLTKVSTAYQRATDPTPSPTGGGGDW